MRFTHQLLQEYFAAVEVGEDLDRGVLASRYWSEDAWWRPTGWEETVLFLAGMPSRREKVIEWLSAVQPELAYRCAVDGDSLCSMGLLSRLGCARHGVRVSISARAEHGRRLNEQEDSRAGVGIARGAIPNIVWYEVPPGQFVVGHGQQSRKVKLTYPFWIAQYPVTYSQFEAFVSGGYNDRSHWTHAGWRFKGSHTGPQPSPVGYWRHPRYHLANHPVVGVTWFEAFAFAQWLNSTLHRSGDIPRTEAANYVVRLPTETEWERVARFPDDRMYPWGKEFRPFHANMEESMGGHGVPFAVRRTTAVGLYPEGRSELGPYDICGNVFEWCLTKTQGRRSLPENNDPEGEDMRVLKGGSWYNPPELALSSNHDFFDADLFASDIGIRVAFAPETPPEVLLTD